MARLFTAGGEGGTVELDGIVAAGTVRARNRGKIRSGRFAYSFDALSSYLTLPHAALQATTGDKSFLRVWFHMPSALPASAVQILRGMSGGTVLHNLYVKTDGRIDNLASGANPTANGVVLDSWNLLEVSAERLAAPGTRFQYRLNGGALVTVDQTSLTVGFDRWRVGLTNTSGPAPDMRMDDIAVNDNTGASENGWPSSTAGVVYLLPKAIVGSGAWEGPNGAAFPAGAWDRLNNTPPQGVSNASANPASQQVRNDTNNAAETGLEVELESPAEAGSPVGSEVKIAQGVAMLATGSTATIDAACSLTSGIVTGETTTSIGTSSGGTFPTNWRRATTPLSVGASLLDRTTRPRMKTARRTASTAPLLDCFMGVMVEVDPKPAARGRRAGTVISS